VRACAAVQQLGVVTEELVRRERREHELLVEPEQVEGVAAFVRVERAVGVPALAGEQPRFDVVQGDLTGPAPVGLAHRLLRHRAGGTEVQRTDPFTQIGIGVGDQPVGRLHDVAVGVVVHAAFGVRHLVTLPRTPRCVS
jgi:hypothetical protein